MENAPLFAALERFATTLRDTSPFGPGIDPLPAYLALAFVALVVLAAILIRRTVTQSRLTRQLADQRQALAVAETRLERLDTAETTLADTREERDTLLGALNAAEAQLKATEQSHAARLEELRGLNDALQARFRNLANEVLEGNSKAFLDRVTERFATHSETAKAELEARQKAIDGLVKPLNERLGQFDTALRDLEKNRTDAYSAIRTQVDELKAGQTNLTGETRKLVQALRAPKTRGKWGEMQLRQVFELSGMSEHVDFNTEVSHRTDDGLQRPDAIVHMPGKRSLIVDAKTPLDAYLDALESEDPEAQRVAFARHAAQVRDHVKALSSKRYFDLLGGTPDFVVMFIPGETFLAAAAEADPTLIQRAMESRVVIATPSTLIALLRTISFGWQQEGIAENAVAIHREAKELYTRLATFAKNLAGVGKALNKSVESYNSAIGSLEARVLPSVRKFESMHVVQEPSDDLKDTPRVEAVPRSVSAPELSLITSDED